MKKLTKHSGGKVKGVVAIVVKVTLFLSCYTSFAGTISAGGAINSSGGSGGSSSANALTNTNLYNYTPSAPWYNYSSLTVTGCVTYPFLNGSNWVPWSGSSSIFTKGNTNFLFFESRGVGASQTICWVFANKPVLTNTAAAFVYEYDNNGSYALPVNDLNAFVWTADDESTYDTTAIFANTYSQQTNLVVQPSGEVDIFTHVLQGGPSPFIIQNDMFPSRLIEFTGGQANSGQTGGIKFFGIPFGQYVTNNQVGDVGFEAGKINYADAYKSGDNRVGLDLGLFFNTDASGGSMVERMVWNPYHYGTPNNSSSDWSRCFITHWKGTWIGDLPSARHTYQDIPPARLTVVASTNDIPMLMLTNQQPSGSKQFTGTIPNGGFWTDNTNVFVGQRGSAAAIPQLSLTQTNFIMGKIYTNGNSIANVTATSVINLAAVAGSAALELRVTGTGGTTNKNAIQSFVTTIAMSYTNTISAVIPANGTYTFTNNSVGAGNSATVIGGQILSY